MAPRLFNECRKFPIVPFVEALRDQASCIHSQLHYRERHTKCNHLAWQGTPSPSARDTGRSFAS